MQSYTLPESASSGENDSPFLDFDDIISWDISESTLEDILIRVRPLDLVMFSGNNLFSKTIQMVEKKKYGIGNISHIGLIIHRDLFPDIKQMKEDKFYIWESTSSKCRVLKTNKIKDIFNKSRFGVQIRDLESVIACYMQSGGRVFWGKIKNNPTKNADQELEWIKDKMNDILKVYGKSSYNLSLIDLGASVYPWLRPLRKFKHFLDKKLNRTKNKPSPLFCSEFIAIIYLELGIIENIDPRNIVPVDFLGITEKGIPIILKKIVEVSKQL